MSDARVCGDCTVCCYIGAVPELNKGPHTYCEHQCKTGCAIYGLPQRPKVCGSFGCAWLRGMLPEAERPDLIGMMFSLNFTGRGVVVFAVETMPNALQTTAQKALVHMAQHVECPIIVSRFESRAPNDFGDLVVVRDELSVRARAIIGECLWRVDDVGVYPFKRAA